MTSDLACLETKFTLKLVMLVGEVKTEYSQFFSYLNLDPPGIYACEAGEATRHVSQVVLVLEYVLRLGPDPVHLGTIGQVGLVTHDEGQGQQGSDGCWLLGPETTEFV